MGRYDRTRTAELVRKAFEILISEPQGLPDEVVLKCIEQSVPLTEGERAPDPIRPSLRVFEALTYQGSIAPAKAGWLRDERGRWSVTEAGRRAWTEFDDPERFILEAGRLSLKGWMAVHFPRFYAWACKTSYQWGIEVKLVRRIGLRRLAAKAIGATAPWQAVLPVQKPRRCVVAGAGFRSLADLLQTMAESEAGCAEGGHTLYLPPASLACSPFRALMSGYPCDAGLKIVKNPGGVDESAYVHSPRWRISAMHRSITHPHRHLCLVANLLHLQGLAPRLYDLIELEWGGRVWTGYVIEHVGGGAPSLDGCRAGLERIQQLERQGMLKVTIPDGYEDDEFLCPGCQGNALVDAAGRFRYIDFQNFLLLDYGRFLTQVAVQAAEASHFGERSVMRGGSYLYQRVPGVRLPAKRDPEERIAALSRLMATAGVSIDERLVLDIGCNVGMMMAGYLKLGARWCHGWDRTAITPHTERLLLALGCTRFSTTGGDMDLARPLEADLPAFLKPMLDGCVVSYLAVRGHLGWLESLGRIPWSFMIYEGHEGETQADFEEYLRQLSTLVPCRVGAVARYADGDSDERTIAILVRVAARPE